MKEWFYMKNVALVGNAMSLFEKSYGEEIDSHDVVVRLNKAAMFYTRFDCPKSHGTRTDVWMVWNANLYIEKLIEAKTRKVKTMHMSFQSRTSGNLSRVDFVYPYELFRELRPKAGRHRNPTTGLMAIDYITSCKPKKLTIYGFDWKDTPTFTDPQREHDKVCPHDFEAERNYVYEQILTQNNIELKK